MAAFTAKDVQTLRERTAVGMMDCKKALVEADGDMDKAIEILREKGLAAAAKKSSRIAAEGAVVAYHDTQKQIGVLLEVNSETDFVAKNQEFQAFGLAIAKTVAKANPADVEDLLNVNLIDSDRTVQENLQDKVLSIGENLKIRRFVRTEGIVSTYIHGGGTVGVMVEFQADAAKAETEAFQNMGKDIAMQIAAMSPQFLDRSAVPADVQEYEKNILMAQLKEDPKMANKPEKVMQGIIAGKLNKHFTEICLLDQKFVKDDEITVKQYVDNVAKELGTEIQVTNFTRFEKGEGLQKREDNFADEVASMMQ